MDLLRYVLAMAVIVAHTNEIAGYNVCFPVSSYDAVGGFFALSGFLMYPSFMKHKSVKLYTIHRARRILPPYLFIVVACTFLLFSISTLSAKDYFSSPGVWKYLLANGSFLNWLHPDLPGVFHDAEHTTSAVNASLWTMKVEWCLYFSVPLFIWVVSRVKIRKEYLAIFVIILSVVYRLIFSYLYYNSGQQIYNILSRQIFGQLSYFYCGMLIYFFINHYHRHNLIYGMIGASLYMVSKTDPICQVVLGPVGLSMLIMSISFLDYDIKAFRHNNNLSYDMYLFHFPFVQLSIYFGVNRYGAVTEFSFVIISTLILSWFVNTYIERRFFNKRQPS